MGLKTYLLASLTILSISGCSWSTEPEVVVQTKYVKQSVPLAQHPKEITLYGVKFWVVNPDNFEEFKTEFVEKNDRLTFIAMSVPDYENMSLNMAELKRYIGQQKNVILYYEKMLSEDTNTTQKETNEQ